MVCFMDDIIKQLKSAMEYDAQGKWEKAHKTVQTIENELAYRIHAYLHRKEGDLENANYWYQRVQSSPFKGNLESEREDILQRLTKCF